MIVNSSLWQKIFKIKRPILIKSVLAAVLVLIVAFVLISLLQRALKRLLIQKGVDLSIVSRITLFVRWFLGLLAVLAAITILGIGVASIWTALSAVLAMAAIGFFAGWSLISSSLAMLIIIIWRPYKVGDAIELLPDGICGRLTLFDHKGAEGDSPRRGGRHLLEIGKGFDNRYRMWCRRLFYYPFDGADGRYL